VDALLPAMPMRLTYGYDTAAKRWFPIHATTRRKGIITDQPYLIAVESLQGGFSVGGRRIPLIEDGTDDVGEKNGMNWLELERRPRLAPNSSLELRAL